MASSKSVILLLFAYLFVLSLTAIGLEGGGIDWGQNGFEGSIEEICASGNYQIVNIAFLTRFGNGSTPVMNLAAHCDPSTSSNNTCAALSSQIKSCQDKNIKVL